jgi:hemoglobin
VNARPEAISNESLASFLTAFYGKARADDLLGPVFSEAIPDERWPHHLERIHAFWSSAMLGTRGYQGNPFGSHLKLGLHPDHFTRWLAIFSATARDHFAPEPALMLIAKANRIAESLQAGLFFRPR